MCADGVTPLQQERGHQAVSLLITAAELRARTVLADDGVSKCSACAPCEPEAFGWLLDSEHHSRCSYTLCVFARDIGMMPVDLNDAVLLDAILQQTCETSHRHQRVHGRASHKPR